jgi:hypothetical protein
MLARNGLKQHSVSLWQNKKNAEQLAAINFDKQF